MPCTERARSPQSSKDGRDEVAVASHELLLGRRALDLPPHPHHACAPAINALLHAHKHADPGCLPRGHAHALVDAAQRHVVVLGLVIEVPSRLAGREAVRVLRSEAQAGLAAAVEGAEGEAGEGGEGHGERQAQREGRAEAVVGADVLDNGLGCGTAGVGAGWEGRRR